MRDFVIKITITIRNKKYNYVIHAGSTHDKSIIADVSKYLTKITSHISA